MELYKKQDNLDIKIGKTNIEDNDVCLIGLSLGALVALRDWNHSNKLILINPPLPNRSVFVWFIRWCKYILVEGLFLERQKFTKNPFKYTLEVARCIKLLQVNFFEKLENISKENVVVIRGKKDNFFCDNDAVQFLRSKGFQVIEVEGCGHNWCENIEKTMIEFTNL